MLKWHYGTVVAAAEDISADSLYNLRNFPSMLIGSVDLNENALAVFYYVVVLIVLILVVDNVVMAHNFDHCRNYYDNDAHIMVKPVAAE